MWYVFFKVAKSMAVARLDKGYSTKGNATKYAKKVFGDDCDGVSVVVAQENPFDVKKG